MSGIDNDQSTDFLCNINAKKRPFETLSNGPESTSSRTGWVPAEPSDDLFKGPTAKRMVTLCNQLYSRGFLDGIGADVVVSAFGRDWNLHRIVLCNSSYFDALLGGGWKESDSAKLVLKFDEDDYITEEAFRIAIAWLYGRLDNCINEQNVLNLLITGTYLGLKDFVSECTDFVLANLNATTIPTYLNFTYDHPCADNHHRIAAGCFAALCRDGYDTLKQCWPHLPPFWVREILASDAFWVPSEYDRYLFVRDLWVIRKSLTQRKCPDDGTPVAETQLDSQLNKESSEPTTSRVSKLCTGPRVKPPCSIVFDVHKPTGAECHLLQQDKGTVKDDEDEEAMYRDIFDNHIQYTHMNFEQIQAIQNDRDPETGLSYVNRIIPLEALWQQVEFRFRVTGAKKEDETLDVVSSKAELQHTFTFSKSPLAKGGEAGRLETVNKPFRFGVEFSKVKELNKGSNILSPAFYYAGSNWRLSLEDSSGKVEDEHYGVFLKRQASNTAANGTLPLSPTTFSQYQHASDSVKIWFKLVWVSPGTSHTVTKFHSPSHAFDFVQGWGWRKGVPKKYFLTGDDGTKTLETLRISVVMGLL